MGQFNVLTECYRGALKMAGNHEMKTLAIPCIGTGLSGFPPRVAARIALQEVREYLDAHTDHHFERIIFCVNSAADEKAYMDFFPVFFPPTHGDLDRARTSDWSANRAALAAQILETRAQLQSIEDEILAGFGWIVPASVTTGLGGIDARLASIRSFLLGPQELKRSLGDLNLLCFVLLTVCGSIKEMIELAKDTATSERTPEMIWNDNDAHMLDRHEVNLSQFLEECRIFAMSLDQVLTHNGSEVDEVATIRQRLESYGVKQKGQDSEGIRDHLDEVLYVREFQRETTSYGRDVVRLPQISSVTRLYTLGELEAKHTLAKPSAIFNQAVCLAREDITRLEVDVMVNSTDSSFLGMGTLDRTVLKKGGSGLQEEVKKFGMCKEGDVKLTPGYLLPAKQILHVIPPEQYRKNTKDVLRNIYREVLHTAMQMKATSIAIPSIGTGMLNYPRRDCASLAMEEVKRFLESAEPTNVLAKIIFVVYSSNDEFIYKSLLPIYFPPPQQTSQVQSGAQVTGQPSRPSPTPRRSLFGSVGEAIRGVRSGKQSEASPINSYEEHALIEFEQHAKGCITCRDIEKLYIKGRDLCDTGYRLAQTLLWYMDMRKDGDVYGMPSRDGKLEVLTDMFPLSLLLLRTVEKSIRDKGPKGPFVIQSRKFADAVPEQAQKDSGIPVASIVPDKNVIEQAAEPPAIIQAHVYTWNSKDLPPAWVPISEHHYSFIQVHKRRIDIHEAKPGVREEGTKIYNHLVPDDDPVLSLDLTPACTLSRPERSNEVVISGLNKISTSLHGEGMILFRCNNKVESDALFFAFQRAINRSRQHSDEDASDSYAQWNRKLHNIQIQLESKESSEDQQRSAPSTSTIRNEAASSSEYSSTPLATQVLDYLTNDLKSRAGSYIGQCTSEIASALNKDPVAISATLQELAAQQQVHNTIDGSTWVISRSPTELPVLSHQSAEQSKPDVYLLAAQVLSFLEHMDRTPRERSGQTVRELASALQLPTSDVWAAIRHLTARKQIYRPSDEETWAVTPKAKRISSPSREAEGDATPFIESADPSEDATNTSSLSERALAYLQRFERTSGRGEQISDLASGLNTSVAELESVLPTLKANGMVKNTQQDFYRAATLAPTNDPKSHDSSTQRAASWVPSFEMTQVKGPSGTALPNLDKYVTTYTDDQGANSVRIDKALVDPKIIQEKGLMYQDETHHMVVHQALTQTELFEMAEKTSRLRSEEDVRTLDYAPPFGNPYWEPPPFKPGLEWTPQLDVYSDDIWHYVSFPASPEHGKKWTRIDKRIVDSQVMDGFVFEVLEHNLLVQAELSMEQIHDLVEMTRARRTGKGKGKGKERMQEETVTQSSSKLPLIAHPWTTASLPGFDFSQVTAETIALQPFVGFGTEDGSVLGPWNERWTQLDKRLVRPDVLDQAELAFKVRGEFLILHGHLSEKKIRNLVKMSGTCGEDRVNSQTSDDASRVEEKDVLVRDVVDFADTPPTPTAESYGRRRDVDPGSVHHFDGIHPRMAAPLSKAMIEEIDASDSSTIPSIRWTRIDQRLVDARVLEAVGEEFESTGDKLILHRVLRRGEIDKWAEKTEELMKQDKQGDTIEKQGDEEALVSTQEKTFDTGAQSNKAEMDKQRKPERSVSRTRIPRETRRGGESWRNGRGEKDRQQAKLDRILAGDMKEDEMRHYRDDDPDFEDAPPSPIQQPSHMVSDTDVEMRRTEDPAPVLDLDTIDIKNYYNNNYVNPRSYARWTRVDKQLVDAQVLIKAGEEFDDRRDVFYVHRVLRRVEVQILAQKTRDRRAVLRELWEKGSPHPQRPRPPRSDTTPSRDAQKSETNTNLPPEENSKTDNNNPSDMPSSSVTQPPDFISELPASNHHCIVYDAGSPAGFEGQFWRWTCCNCGCDNSVQEDAGCRHCENHWRE
jgi:O-acetyl-ADP-ribose deacetylase (regulator of RNase III)